MKRAVRISITFLLFIFIFSVSVFAEEKEEHYTKEQMESIVRNYENNEEMLNTVLCSDSKIRYWQMINNIKKNKVLAWALDESSKLIGEYPEKQDYAEILVNIITMQSGQLAEQIETQSRFDDLKNIGDFGWAVMDIASEFIGASDVGEIVSAAFGTGNEGLQNVIIKNNEIAKYYETTFQDYSQANDFLMAVSKYAESEELRNVASTLLDVNETLLINRLEYLADTRENIAKYEWKFFQENMSMELLKETDLYSSDEIVKSFVDGGIKLKNIILNTLNIGKFTFKSVVLAGDIGLGTSDVYNRYQEMKVVSDIANAITRANKAISVSNEAGKLTLESIQQKCNYYKALLVTHARGEYLIYQLLVNDGGIFSDIRYIKEYFKGKDTAKSWYQGQKEILMKYSNILDNIFDVSRSIDLDNLVTDAFMEECAYSVPINNNTNMDEKTEIICTYRIPQINLEGNEIEQINKKIYDAFYPAVENSIKEINEYGYPVTSEEVLYYWALNDDILSLVVRNSNVVNNDYTYMVFNISIFSGAEVSNDEILKKAGLTKEQFYEKAKQVLGSSFWEPWDRQNENFKNQSFVEFFNDRLQKTISDENIAQTYPYINEKGELCIIAKKYSVAGGDYYWWDLNMVDFTFLPYYAEMAKTAENKVNPETITEEELLGEWQIDEAYTMEVNGMSMWDFYGTSFSDGDTKMVFNADGSYQYYVAWCYGNGTFSLDNGEITVNLQEGDPIQGSIKLPVIAEGKKRIALDQGGDGKKVFWMKK